MKKILITAGILIYAFSSPYLAWRVKCNADQADINYNWYVYESAMREWEKRELKRDFRAELKAKDERYWRVVAEWKIPEKILGLEPMENGEQK